MTPQLNTQTATGLGCAEDYNGVVLVLIKHFELDGLLEGVLYVKNTIPLQLGEESGVGGLELPVVQDGECPQRGADAEKEYEYHEVLH